MRDTNLNMIELLEVSRENNIYSSLISLEINNEKIKVRFGIDTSDYSRLKRILEFRPWENTGVAPYRYFFALSYSKKENDLSEIKVRVEQNSRHKQFYFELSNKYISNILWFDTIKEKHTIEKFIET